MSDSKDMGIGMLALRMATGSLLAAHGAQKLFGAFNGPGLKTWNHHVESMGMEPSELWGPVGAVSEFAGGTLTALGFLNPIGPLATISAMTVAARKVHWNKPVFVSEGGAELPLTNIGAALVVAIEGPGKYSMDHMFGLRLPAWMRVLAVLATALGLVAALNPELLPVGVQKILSSPEAVAE